MDKPIVEPLFSRYDTADYLDSEEMITCFLDEMKNDPEAQGLLGSAIYDVLKARAITQLSEASGLDRQTVCKALKPEYKFPDEIMERLLAALNVNQDKRKAA